MTDAAKPTVHMICGSTGAGKTTFARALAERLGAPRFSIDEFMRELFWPDAPKEPDLQWALERVGRCERLAWALAGQAVAAGRDAVLDLGFSKKEQRERFYALAAKAGARAQLHFLDVPVEIRRRRVLQRNEAPGAASIVVDDAAFAFMESYFEAPAGAELSAARVSR